MKFVCYRISRPSDIYVFDSQPELAEHFGCSARTIRKSLQEGGRGEWILEKYSNDIFSQRGGKLARPSASSILELFPESDEESDEEKEEIITAEEYQGLFNLILSNLALTSHSPAYIRSRFSPARQVELAKDLLSNIEGVVQYKMTISNKAVNKTQIKKIIENAVKRIALEIQVMAPEVSSLYGRRRGTKR